MLERGLASLAWGRVTADDVEGIENFGKGGHRKSD